MEYNILLAKIDLWIFKTRYYDDTYEVHGILKALRSVVELHKPDQWGEECKHCDNGSYPCETIQAIEKELG